MRVKKKVSRWKSFLFMLCAVVIIALTLTLLLIFAGPDWKTASSAPVINEVLCSNSASFKAYDGRYYDWVELYNPSGRELSLDGY